MHRPSLLALLTCALSLAPAPLPAAHAAPAVGETTNDILGRYVRKLAKADKTLNDVHRALAKRLDAGARKRLVAASLAWIRYRDAERVFEEDMFRGGTFAPTEGVICALRLTLQRTEELRDAEGLFMPDPEGPMSPAEERAAHPGIVAAHDREDRRLNVSYKALKSQGDAENQRLLLKAQLAWLAYRDAEASFVTGFAHGPDSVQNSGTASRTRSTATRTDDLVRMAKGFGSDNPMPVNLELGPADR